MFLKPYKGTRNIWVKGVNELLEPARPITDDARRPIPLRLTADGKYILFVQDRGGKRKSQCLCRQSAEKPAAEQFRAPALTDENVR